MRLTVEAFFKVDVWNSRFLLNTSKLDWAKAIVTDQGLDRVGDSYWIGGVHVGSGTETFNEQATGVTGEVFYNAMPSNDESRVGKNETHIQWTREMQYRYQLSEIGNTAISELALSWDDDSKTGTTVLNLPDAVALGPDEELIVTCRVVVSESLDDVETGTIDFGAVYHDYTIKPCFYERYQDAFIGTPLAQKDGRVYSGPIPADPAKEPEGGIDTHLGLFKAYSFNTRSKNFTNFFTLSSPNAVTQVATSHTIGLPSAYGVEFSPPIDKDFNRELTLDFQINWDRA